MSEIRPFRNRVLRSWKEIANHFRVSVRTVQRWEKEKGLPVHRDVGGQPTCWVEELNLWESQRREEALAEAATSGPLGKLRTPFLFGALTLLLAGAVGTGLWWRTGEDSFADLPEPASGRAGPFAWVDSLPGLRQAPEWDWAGGLPSDRYLLEDLDGDGEREALVNFFSDPKALEPGKLQCYSESGDLRWEFVYGREFSWNGRRFNPYYVGRTIRTVQTPRGTLVVTAAIHHRWFPCQVALIDPSDGKLVGEYWHPGALTHTLVKDLDGDGVGEVVLAGINNPGLGLGHTALVALKVPFARRGSDEKPFEEASKGKEWKYYLFPRPDASWVTGRLILLSSLREEADGQVTLISSLTQEGGSLFYLFDSALDPVEFRSSDDTLSLHDRLWIEGLLDHRFSETERDCLSRLQQFDTAPDGNSPDISASWSECEFHRPQP